MTKFRAHICGLSGDGFDCPACGVFEDRLGVSEILADRTREVEHYSSAILALMRVMQIHFGDEACRVPTQELATFLDQEIHKLRGAPRGGPPTR